VKLPELNPSIREALEGLNRKIVLPAMYDELTREERARVREEYARLQGGLCPFCLQPLVADPPPVIQRLPIDSVRWPPEFFRWPQHLHHNHRTGLTIGTYHARCNAVLAAYFRE
jgi:hypothetical protein